MPDSLDMGNVNANKKAKRRRVTVVMMLGVLAFSIGASAYYLVDSAITENSYKVYVSGSNNAMGLQLSYDPLFGKGYYDLTGKGLRIEDNSRRGLSYGSSSIQGQGTRNYDVLSYLMSVGSNQEYTVDTNVYDNGKAGEANGDQFLTSKFYLKNTQEADELNAKDGVVHYAIGLTVDKDVKNAARAIRFALIEIKDEESIYNYSTGEYNNEAFVMNVFAQPKVEELENGDTKIYTGDEEDSQEYVASTITGQFTNDENASLVKNPNKGYEEDTEGWKCTNLHYSDDKVWHYDSLKHETDESKQVFSLDPQETRAYVVAAWYEASDPDHKNEIASGYTNFTFTFYAVEE